MTFQRHIDENEITTEDLVTMGHGIASRNTVGLLVQLIEEVFVVGICFCKYIPNHPVAQVVSVFPECAS